MSGDENSSNTTNGFGAVWAELIRRTVRPRHEVVYWSYFVLCVVILGSLAIWVEWIQEKQLPAARRDWNNIYTSFVTFFPVLIGSSCIQMVFESVNRRMQAFSLMMFTIALISGAVLVSSARPAGGGSWVCTIFMYMLSLWIWWIANADNTRLHDNNPPGDAPLGGDPSAPLSGGFGHVKV